MHNKRVNKILRQPSSRATRKTVAPSSPDGNEPVDLTQLGQQLQHRFLELPADSTRLDFIARAKKRPHSWWLTTTHRIVRSFMSDYDANGLLGMYPMHLLSTAQWRSLLHLKEPGRLLDVGAGDGGLTRELSPLFTSITTTETSRAMARRLRRRGYECLEQDLSQTPLARQFDCVTCLNVVDRTPLPRQLIAALATLVTPGGALVIATPLPLRAFYYEGPRTLEPRERLSAPGPSWERAVGQFVAAVEPLLSGFELRRWSKAPYLSWGDHARDLYSLDDFVGVWQRTATSTE